MLVLKKNKLIKSFEILFIIVVGVSLIFLQQYLGHRDGITIINLLSFLILYYMWIDIFQDLVKGIRS